MKKRLLLYLLLGQLSLFINKIFAQTYNDGAMYLEMWVTYSWVENYDDFIDDDEYNFLWYGADNANIDGMGWRPLTPPQAQSTIGPFPKPNQIAVNYSGSGWVTGTNVQLFSQTFGTAGNTPQTVPQYLMLHGEKWEDDCWSCNSSGFLCLGGGCGMGAADRYRYNPSCCTSVCSGCDNDDIYCNASVNSTINYRAVPPCTPIDNATPSTGWVGDFASTSCGSNDLGAEVSVYRTPPIPSSFSAVPNSMCTGGGSVTLNLAGAVNGGSYDIYNESTGVFIATAVSGPTYVLNVTSTTTFRLYTRNGSCRSLSWLSATITVGAPVSGGTVASNQTICSNGDPVAFTNTTPASGGVGAFSYQWESQLNCGGGWGAIGGATSITYDPPAGLSQTTCYRRVATNTCGSANSNSITVTVLPSINYGTISGGGGSFCTTADPTAMNVSPSGGTGTFTYQWYYQNGNATCPSGSSVAGWTPISGATAASYDPPAGLTNSRTYAVIVDPTGSPDCSGGIWANNCIAVTIIPPITVSASHTDASCSGVFDGTISVTASGGSGLFSYSLNGGPIQPGNVFTGLAAGTYSIMVIDNANCSASTTESIGNSYSVVGTLDSTWSVSCFGANDGAAFVSMTGGISPYDYSINNLVFSSASAFTGLGAGNYSIITRDSKGCVDIVSATITQPAVINPIIDSTVNGLCSGSATAGVYISVTGGTPNYNYLWNDALGTTTQDLINAASGTYNVTITDNNGCTATIGSAVSQPLPLFLSIEHFNDALCGNDSTGAIDVTANGGTPPYSYAWNNGLLTEDLSNLPAGLYSVTVTDGNGCQQTLTQIISAPVNTLSSSVAVTNVSCSGACNGAVDLTVSGGTTPYSFLWSTFSGSEDLNNVCGATYTVIITDKNGCVHRDSAIVTESPPLVISSQVTNISCNGAADGAIDLTVTGGAGGYTYDWSDLVGNNDPEDRTGLSQASYAVIVTDINNCTATATVSIINPPAVSLSLLPVNPLCNAANGPNTAGRITGAVAGGTPGYTYLWNDFASTPLPRNNVTPGTYILTVTDSRGCTTVDSVRIIEPDPMIYSVFRKDIRCNGNCDGSLMLTPYGGTPAYSFAWSNGSSSKDIENLCAGNYTVTITDVNDCTVSGFFIIQESAPLALTLNKTDVACQGGNTGSISTVVTGGRTPYTYLWVGDPVPNPLSASQSNIGGGDYCVVVTDSSGCQASACVAVIGQPNPITVVPSIKRTTCFGGTDATILLDVNGGQSPYSYSWSTTPVQTGSAAMNIGSGSYTVTISDASGCSFSQSFTVPETLPIAVSATTLNQVVCQSGSDGIIVITAANGAEPYTYSLEGITQSSDTFRNVGPGTFSVAVRDANGCEGTNSVTILPATGELSVYLTADKEVVLANQDARLSATPNSTEPIVKYIWQPSDAGFDFSNCSDSSLCPDPRVRLTTTTTIIVTAINAAGCATTDTLRIEVENEIVYFFPTAFTPNGDGLNDRFEFNVLGVTTADVKIWNRWGEQVFSNPAQPNGFTGVDGWDGTFRGKKAQFDTYTYQIDLTFFDGRKETLAGTITVMQ